jgi:alpha-D-xyloside xylohydrolase
VPWIYNLADPPELPVRPPGEEGLSRVTSAEVMEHEPERLRLRARTSAGEVLFLAVESAGEGVIRVRLTTDDHVTSRSAPAIRLVTPGRFPGSQVTLHADGAVVDAGSVSAHITLDPWRIRFLDSSGRLLTEENIDEADFIYRLRILPIGRSLGPDGESLAFHEAFTARPDEHFVGLGEKFGALDKRGQHIMCWNYDALNVESERSYKNVPLYLSSRGYGILVDTGTAADFDICHATHACVQIAVPDDQLDYYVIAGPTPAQVIDRYHGLTGRPVAPPRWALGTWMSTGFLKINQRGTLTQARRIREHGLPCDVLHLDTYWQKEGNWSDLRWDEERFPDPKAMLEELHGLGFRVCLWMNPYISANSPVFAEGAARGYFLKRADGSVYVANVWHDAWPACGIVDFTNSAATAWFQGLLRPLLEQGVDVFKTDFGEGVPVDAYSASGVPGEALHNIYSLLFNDAVADITQEVAGHRVVWARSSFIGGQRHGPQWAGDNNTTFTSMASTLRGGLSYAFSGVPYWSHDVGGFTGKPADDLMVRSAQFGALSPMMRFHGTTSRFPWEFEKSADLAIVDAVRLRYSLLPYLHSAAVEATYSGMPMMRPLPFHAPDEPGAWTADLEYLLGPDLLVAPMTNPEGERHVYLPEGEWIDYWTGETHSGGRHLHVRKPLDQVPLFVRRNALIALAPPSSSTGDHDIVVACWGAGDSESAVHTEDGAATVRLVRRGSHADLTVDGPLRVTGVTFPVVADAVPPATVHVNGRPIS